MSMIQLRGVQIRCEVLGRVMGRAYAGRATWPRRGTADRADGARRRLPRAGAMSCA